MEADLAGSIVDDEDFPTIGANRRGGCGNGCGNTGADCRGGHGGGGRGINGNHDTVHNNIRPLTMKTSLPSVLAMEVVEMDAVTQEPTVEGDTEAAEEESTATTTQSTITFDR